MGKLALSVVGSAALTAQDLAPALEDMKRKLMERNVAEEIAGQVVDSVAHSLEGQKLSSFTGGWAEPGLVCCAVDLVCVWLGVSMVR